MSADPGGCSCGNKVVKTESLLEKVQHPWGGAGYHNLWDMTDK